MGGVLKKLWRYNGRTLELSNLFDEPHFAVRAANMPSLRRQNFYPGGDVHKMRWVTSHDASDFLATGERRVQRVVNASTHHAATLCVCDRGLIVRKSEHLDHKSLAQIER